MGICVLFLLSTCTKEDLNKQTSSKSFSLDGTFSTYQAGVVDNSGEYLYFTLLNVFTNETELLKFNLNTLEKVKSITLDPGTTITFGNNLLYGADNHLYALEQNARSGTGNYEIWLKFTPDLEVVDTDTVYRIDSVPSYMPSLNLRSRLCKVGDGQLARATTVLSYDLQFGVKYELMDLDFNKSKSELDTSSYPGPGFRLGVNDLEKSSDGGYLLATIAYAPSTAMDCYFEKRDADFNLLWSTTYATPGLETVSKIIESNGHIYAYCYEIDSETQLYQLFLLQLDNQGNVVKRLDLESSGREAVLRETFEQTEDGGFLCPGMTSVGASPSSSKAILYKVSPNLEIESYQVFGESVISGNILKVSANKYLYLYGEMGFNPEEGNLRTVMTLVDQNGKIIQ